MKRACKAAIVAVIFMTVLCGCETESRYKVLGFFFDGVPGQDNAVPRVSPLAVERHTEHGPYAAKLCEGCHLRGSNRLLAPIEELCFFCHTFKMDKKWVHGPLASGGCRICHNPHSSSIPYLLVSEPMEFCFHCHDANETLSRDIHKESGVDCTVCHHAHMSEKRFLLK